MDFYSILNVKEDAAHTEIKKAFRKKLKEHHPDLHDSKPKKKTVSNAESLVHIIDAYNTLSNPVKRKQYDARKNIISQDRVVEAYGEEIKLREKKVFDYEKFLLARQGRWEYRVKLFLYDLVFCSGNRAASIYETLKKDANEKRLRDSLGYYDYFDCMFLLAEHYQDKGSISANDKALELFLMISVLETERPYFKSYMEEVMDRIFLLLQNNNMHELDIHKVHSILNNMKHLKILPKQKKKIEKILS